MAKLLEPEIEVQRLADNSVEPFVGRVQDMVLAMKSRSQDRRDRALGAMADLLRFTQAQSDLLGRRRVFMELDHSLRAFPESKKFPARRRLWWSSALRYADAPERFEGDTPLTPDVPFKEAVRDLVKREPRLAPSADLVAQVYSREHGFALARAVNVTVTERVKEILRQSFEEGVTREASVQAIQQSALLQQTEPFARQYAETVYRTNLTTAYTAGRFQQAEDPDVAQAMPAFRYAAIKDSAVRRGRPEDNGENHLALDGLIAPTGSRIWRVYAPPNGYNCRCGIRMVSIFQLRRMGIIRQLTDEVPEPSSVPSDEVVHPRFRRGRPDSRIYLGVGG